MATSPALECSPLSRGHRGAAADLT